MKIIEILRPKTELEKRIEKLKKYHDEFLRMQAKDSRSKNHELVKIGDVIISNIAKQVRWLRGERIEKTQKR